MKVLLVKAYDPPDFEGEAPKAFLLTEDKLKSIALQRKQALDMMAPFSFLHDTVAPFAVVHLSDFRAVGGDLRGGVKFHNRVFMGGPEAEETLWRTLDREERLWVEVVAPAATFTFKDIDTQQIKTHWFGGGVSLTAYLGDVPLYGEIIPADIPVLEGEKDAVQ